METVKACIHCDLLRTINGKLTCTAAEALSSKLDLVLGEYPQRGAYEMRAPKAACGPEGKLYREKSGPMQADVEAVRMAYGPNVALAVRDAAVSVMMLPNRAIGAVVGGVVGVARGTKARLGRFAAKCAAARAAFKGIQDNTQEPPMMLTADPVEEAKAIQAGGPAVVNAELAATLDKVADENVAALNKAAAAMADTPVADKVASLADPTPVPLAQPTDPQQEAAVASKAAAVVAVLLLGWIAAGMVHHASETRGTLANLLKVGSATCCEKNTGRCYPCETGWQATAARFCAPAILRAGNGKARCCYRMPDGSTRCYDCSTQS